MWQKASGVGKNLKRLRKVSGLTLGQLASALGVSYQQVQKYESGGNKLPIDKLFELRNFYNVPYEAFFEGLNEFEEPSMLSGNHRAELFAKLNTLEDMDLREKIERAILIFLE